ncbi:uncharacterized protein LOC132313930 [Cornus florida]|uniref:uncharacterized protein LOC132313930 n=1 Tax=Cornus florida TaxID=4283 RepID=UPI0028995AD2|nr:uncharacterized protein LOC132313930 [Cornus florida]
MQSGFKVPQALQPVALSIGSYPGTGSTPTASRHQSGHQGNFQQSGAQGRVYALPWADTSVETSTVRGIFLVFSSWARVLIDTDASHLFISVSFAYSLGLEVTQWDGFLYVNTLVGGQVFLDRVCRGCAIEIARRTLEFNFIIFHMTGFFRAMIDCFCGRVTVCIPKGDCFHFVGDQSDSHSTIIFSIGDWSRHRSYLASLLVDKDSSSGRIFPIVVMQFLDVFPEKLTKFPSLREVVFAIDIIPGTASISMAP